MSDLDEARRTAAMARQGLNLIVQALEIYDGGYGQPGPRHRSSLAKTCSLVEEIEAWAVRETRAAQSRWERSPEAAQCA